jgi:hypothetical protein
MTLSSDLRKANSALDCKAFCEFLLRTVFDKDYLRLPYNKQKRMEPKFCTVSLLLENLSKKYDPKGFP